MMRQREAARLARRSIDRHGEIAGSPRRRRAYWQLTEAATLGDLVAARALATVGRSDTGMLDVIWGEVPPSGCVPIELAGAVSLLVLEPDQDVLTVPMRRGVAAAAALEHPVADIARAKLLTHLDQELVDRTCRIAEAHPHLAEFCRQHQLVPAAPPDQARYLLLTDQFVDYQALDPGGTLLTEAYDAADDGDRAAIRAAALRHGVVDLVQTLTHRRKAHTDDLSRDELTRMARTLADRGDWPRLWDVVTDVRVLDAVSLVRLFPSRWQPDEATRRLVTALRSADPEQLGALVSSSTLVCRIDPGGPVDLVAVAPDLSEVALTWEPDADNCCVTVYDVGTGTALDEYPTSWPEAPLTHLGNGVVLTENHGLYRCTGGETQQLTASQVHQLAAAAGHYLAWTADEVLCGSAAETSPVRKAMPGYGALLGFADGEPESWYPAGAAADGSRFTVGRAYLDDRPTRFLVVDAAGELLADSGVLDEPLDDIAFYTQDELITLHAPDDESNGTLRRWRMDGGQLHERLPRYTDNVDEVAGLPGQGWLVITDGRMLRFLDPATLEELPAPEVPWPLRNREDDWLSNLVSVGEHALAFVVHHGRIGQPGHTCTVELHDLRRLQVARLLTTPISRMRPTDVGTLADHADEPAVQLLRACLAHRFGTDVHIGGPPVGLGTDIALGEHSDVE